MRRDQLLLDFKPKILKEPVEWRISDGLTDYQTALNVMEQRALDISNNVAREMVWLLEHPPLYTAGTSSKSEDLIAPDRFPVHKTGRGGQYTYHGPGQRIAYVMLDLKRRKPDVRQFVSALEEWIISTLDQMNIKAARREDRVGVWVTRPDKAPLPDGTITEDKIAAIGIRLKKWVSFHGISLNVEPELDHFSGIVPCGVQQYGVTSLVDLGLPITMEETDIVLRETFEEIFGSTQSIE